MNESVQTSLVQLLRKHSEEIEARDIGPADVLGDLGIDSLSLLSLAVDLENTFGISIDDADLYGVRTVEDLEALLLGLRNGD